MTLAVYAKAIIIKAGISKVIPCNKNTRQSVKSFPVIKQSKIII